jgi:carboxypeptidase Taq
MSAYQQLEDRFARVAILSDVTGLLGWDTETMMPKGAIEGRSDQMATLEDLSHEIVTSSETGDLIGEASKDGAGLSAWQAANLREMERSYVRASAIPRDLLLATARANTLCQHAWQQAREDNDFKAVKDKLAEVVRLQRETGEALGNALGLAPYDALLDQYDPGARSEGIERLFAPVRAALPELIERVVGRQKSAPAIIPLEGPFPIAQQEKLCRVLLERLGFDFDRGRLDVSAHPFSGGSYGDVRVTTRFSENTLLPSLLATIHEGGHALYEQGRPHDWRMQPVGLAKGMAVHESQSMIMELQAAKTEAFLGYLLPLVRAEFGGEGPAWSGDNLRRIIRQVERGFIRVDADELTYPAHILVRHGIESALIAGDLTVDDLPGAFNEAVERLLGLKVPDDRRGCLQDIHWYGGAYGYFPMYLVGAMIAAQLFQTAREKVTGIEDALAEGDFRPLVAWLRENIHGKASLMDRDELVESATGAPASADAYLAHLERRYISN